MWSRRLLRVVAVAIGLAVALLGVLFVSAVLDTPSKTVESTTVVDAPRAEVWSALVDVASYAQWNPAIVQAEGEVAIGSSLELRYDDGDAAEVEVLDVKERRKLRWRDRLVLPGVRDREFTIRVRDTAGGATRVVVVQRIEGVGAPFYDTGSDADRIERMLEALAARASAGSA